MLKRHAEFLAFLALWSYMVLVIGTQLGIRHGRELQKQDERIAVESSVLDEYLLQLPPDAVRQKRPDCAVLAQALLAAGWNVQLIPTMLAISRAEAGCNPLARHRTMTEDSLGYLQLNLRAHKFITQECATDALCASWAALRVYRLQGLSAWTSYRTGAWRKFVEVSE